MKLLQFEKAFEIANKTYDPCVNYTLIYFSLLRKIKTIKESSGDTEMKSPISLKNRIDGNGTTN